jgi:hydroxyethylthiazole kinase
MIHLIQNGVTRELVANGVLAYGGSPIMSENPLEFKALYSSVSCLVLNLGMLDEAKKSAMITACELASQKGVPIGVDPVGIHVSPYRKDFFLKLMEQFELAYVRGNMDEISSVFMDKTFDKKTLEASLDFNTGLKNTLITHKVVWFISGERDAVIGNGRFQLLAGGSSKLRKITGAGCLLTSLIAVNIDCGLESFRACIKAGEDLNAVSEELNENGLGTLRVKLIDGLERLGEKDD